MKFSNDLGKALCCLVVISCFYQLNVTFSMDHVLDRERVYINWNELNSDPLITVENPEKRSYKVPMTSSFAFNVAKEFLRSDDPAQTRWGTETMIILFKDRYPPVLDLFDAVCDERGCTLCRSVDKLENILVQHFSNKHAKLRGWEALNSDPLITVKNPEKPDREISMTSSFAFATAKEFLKSDSPEQIRWGAETMITLFKKQYPPVLDLFDAVCDERGATLHKSVDALKCILAQHFLGKRTKLDEWEKGNE